MKEYLKVVYSFNLGGAFALWYVVPRFAGEEVHTAIKTLLIVSVIALIASAVWPKKK